MVDGAYIILQHRWVIRGPGSAKYSRDFLLYSVNYSFLTIRRKKNCIYHNFQLLSHFLYLFCFFFHLIMPTILIFLINEYKMIESSFAFERLWERLTMFIINGHDTTSKVVAATSFDMDFNIFRFTSNASSLIAGRSNAFHFQCSIVRWSYSWCIQTTNWWAWAVIFYSGHAWWSCYGRTTEMRNACTLNFWYCEILWFRWAGAPRIWRFWGFTFRPNGALCFRIAILTSDTHMSSLASLIGWTNLLDLANMVNSTNMATSWLLYRLLWKR